MPLKLLIEPWKSSSASLPFMWPLLKRINGRILSVTNGCLARWLENFDQLYIVDHIKQTASRWLVGSMVRVPTADPPTAVGSHFLLCQGCGKVEMVGRQLVPICDISGKLLKAWIELTIRRLHAILCTVWRFGNFPQDCEEYSACLCLQRERNRTVLPTIAFPSKIIPQLLLRRVRSHLLEFERSDYG